MRQTCGDLSNGELVTTLVSRHQAMNHSSSITQSQKVDGRLEQAPRLNTTTHSHSTVPIRKIDHQSELRADKSAASEATVPFPQFTSFPKEIRERIWELSLPATSNVNIEQGLQP